MSTVISNTLRIPSIIPQNRCSVIPSRPLFPSNLKPISSGLLKFSRIDLGCNSIRDLGENESKTVLDAFFLGKAVGEALNERIISSVGEFLSIVGRLQAEQLKQLFEFQEEVLEKARQAKEQASREAIEAKQIISDTTSLATSTVNRVPETVTSLGTSTVHGVTETVSSVSDSVISAASSSLPKRTNDDPFFRLIEKD